MSLLEEKLQQSIAKESEINRSINSMNILPSKEEREYVNAVIRKISSIYSNELMKEDV